jgi:hypothetical protein
LKTLVLGCLLLFHREASAQADPCGSDTLEQNTELRWPGDGGATIVHLAGEIVFEGRPLI